MAAALADGCTDSLAAVAVALFVVAAGALVAPAAGLAVDLHFLVV